MAGVSALLKAFVIGGGLLLVVGTLLLVVLLVAQATGERRPPDPAAPIEVALPEGARVQQVVPDGRRLVLLGVDAAGAQFVAVLDAESGQRLRLIRLRPGAQAVP